MAEYDSAPGSDPSTFRDRNGLRRRLAVGPYQDPHFALVGGLTGRVGERQLPRARRQNWKTLIVAYGAGMSRFRFLRP